MTGWLVRGTGPYGRLNSISNKPPVLNIVKSKNQTVTRNLSVSDNSFNVIPSTFYWQLKTATKEKHEIAAYCKSESTAYTIG